jgi:hypothetical protein
MHGRGENLEQKIDYLKEMTHSVNLYEFGRVILI